jgi:hypothetical protein
MKKELTIEESLSGLIGVVTLTVSAWAFFVLSSLNY